MCVDEQFLLFIWDSTLASGIGTVTLDVIHNEEGEVLSFS